MRSTAAAVAVAMALVAVVSVSPVARVAAYNNGVGALPAMGWNTWCTDDLCGAIDLCTDAEVRSVADAIVDQGLDKLGYQYVNLDDCWADQSRDAAGNLQPAPAQFPYGMKALADYVHSKGLKLGLYTDVGTETCKWKRPGAYGHYEQDAATLAGWGVDFVKADNCHRVGDDLPQYRNYSKALNATGRPILFSLCNWGIENVEEWGPEVGQMYRFQMDHLPFWDWPPTAQGAGLGQGVLNVIEFMAVLQAAGTARSGPFGYMDPDFAETLMPLTLPLTESRTEFAFWTLWSAPLLVATDLRNLTAEKRAIVANAEVIAVDQDPLGVAGARVFNRSDGGQLWVKPLAAGDHTKAAILFNAADAPAAGVAVTATWDQFGWPAGARVAVRDLWARQDLGVFVGGLTRTVLPRDHFYFVATLQSSAADDADHSDGAYGADELSAFH